MIIKTEALDQNEFANISNIINDGGIIVVPTETVYGLAASALSEEGVKSIFRAKKRPPTNPLIVHVSSIEQAKSLVVWNDLAETLANAFWPGPLTLILPKKPHVPDIVTAGLDSVAVRFPSHQVFLDIINACGVPIAAPSANLYTQISPTRIDHLSSEIVSAARLVIDGGPTEIGLESTIISLLKEPTQVMRPGLVTLIEMADLIGPIKIPRIEPALGPKISPGLSKRHYAPKTPVLLKEEIIAFPVDVGVIAIDIPESSNWLIKMPDDYAEYCHRFYDALHEADTWGCREIWIQSPRPSWEMVWNRVNRIIG